MDARTAQDKFNQADTLFRQGNYEAALEVLSELNAAFPNTKNVMYPAALCMEKLGRIEEGKQLCHAMIRQFDNQKARELLNYLEVAPRIAGKKKEPVSVDLAMPERPKPAPPAATKSKTSLYICIAVLVWILFAYGRAISLGIRLPVQPDHETIAATHASMMLLFFTTLPIAYFLNSYLMKRICINAGSSPGILIWFPLIKMIPVMRAANMSLWWIVSILIPFAGITVYFGVLWVKLCQACNKEPWIGILIFIPFVNIGMVFYLAFSEP